MGRGVAQVLLAQGYYKLAGGAGMRGTTNDEHRFEPGEVVQFAGEDYVVERNFGACGAVAVLARGIRIFPFWWVFRGEPARRTGERFAVRLTRDSEMTRRVSS